MKVQAAFDEQEWEALCGSLSERFGRKPGVQGMLFLIGHRELGQLRTKFSKNAKQDLMHVGTCTLLSRAGYYHFLARDEDGWPHYEPDRSMPRLSSEDQERLLKQLILDYFREL